MPFAGDSFALDCWGDNNEQRRIDVRHCLFNKRRPPEPMTRSSGRQGRRSKFPHGPTRIKHGDRACLVVAKVLPPLERGEPPDFQAIYTPSTANESQVGWDLLWNDQPIGWASSRSTRMSPSTLEVYGRVHFSRLP